MQDVLVFLIFGGAVAFLVRHWFFASSGKSSCGSCKSCETKKAPSEPQLIQIDLGPRAK